MSRRLMPVAAFLIVAGLTLGACAKKKPEPPPAAPTPPAKTETPTTPAPPPPPPTPAPTPAPKPLTEEELFAKETVESLNAKRPLADVFFALDSIEISSEGRASLQKNAEWLKRWGTVKATIEGHADSRGTNEYNLALGERRAGAVREYLVSLGVAADRLATVSKGEEQPFCAEENEGCWQQNRRGHFMITAK